MAGLSQAACSGDRGAWRAPLSEPHPGPLKAASDGEWREALEFCDRSQLTLELGRVVRDAMPGWVRERIDADAARNLLRLRIIEDLYRDVGGRLSAAAIDFVALKGLTQCPDFGSEPESRVQYDIDLYAPPALVYSAREVLLALGFESIEGMEGFPTDHLPAMIRKTGWQWRGDYFDPEIPLAVELHFQYWNPEVERLAAPGVDEFWERRTTRTVAGVTLPVLCPPDALGYAALHLLRHLLRGNVRPFHVLELARFLALRAGDDEFWARWRDLHAPELRRLESVAFRLAMEWFGGYVPEAVAEEWESLPPSTTRWFEEYALSPAAVEFSPNKDELWLHMSLLSSRRDYWPVARRRLLPARLPGPVDAVYVPDAEMSWRIRIRKRVRYAVYCAGRIRHHLLTLPRTGAAGSRLWWRGATFGEEFWRFLAAGVVFNFGLFIFVLLYNLRLLEIGFREDFLGLLNGAATLGTVAGTLPAAWVLRRAGLRNTFVGTFAACSALVVLRSLASGRVPLIGLSVAWGLAFSVWAVGFAPMIAAAVPQKRRPAAFSAFFACMFATGIAADWIGGRLPAMLQGKQPALLLSATLVAAALWPAMHLKSGAPAREAKRIYPRGRFLIRYLAAFAVWNLATGTFNPFANAFFARQHVPVEQIGTIFSVSQLAQAGAVLLAPVVFRHAGLVGGVVYMMLATAAGLAGLAAEPAGAALAMTFIGYMVFQWMSEPGLTTLLMNQVDERERGGAAAMNYLVAFSAQAAASIVGGQLLADFGYGRVIAGAAGAAVAAALLFRRLPGVSSPELSPAHPESAAGNVPE